MNRTTRIEILVVVLVLSLSLALRLTGLNRFVVCDEVRWTCRSIGFRQALIERNLANTFRTGHPGVITTWLGGMFIPWREVAPETKESCTVTQDASELSHTGESVEERTEFMHAVGESLFKARRGVALFTWLSVIGMYFLVRHLWGSKIAVLSLILIALDPFYLGLSRFLHIDAVLTSLMSLSVLSLLVFLWERKPGERRMGFLVLSGVMGGLAFLQKSPAMFLGPFVALVMILDLLRKGLRRESLLRWARNIVIWGSVAVAVYVALWPSMWVQPVASIRRILDKAIGYAQEGHSSGNYFLGRPDEDPGWLFYPVAALFRLNPVALLGLIFTSVPLLTSKTKPLKEHFGLTILLLYSGLFGLFMSLGDKMFDRYLLPVFPALEIGAAIGLTYVIETIWRRRNRIPWLSILIIALVIQTVLTVPHHPHYLTYYSPLLGGIEQARKILLVGWGEGYEEAAAHLNAKPDAQDLQVAMPAFNVFSPQFNGMARPVQRYSVWGSDYVMLYLSHVQRQRYPELMKEYFHNPQAEPEHVVTLHGVDYVWLYRNDHFGEPMRYIEERGQPDERECILVNGDGLFAKHYSGDLPRLTFHTQYDLKEDTYTYWTPEQVSALLNENRSACRKIWYVRYPEAEPRAYFDLLENRGMLERRAEFPHVEVTLHRLVVDRVARQSVDLQFGDLRLLSYGVTDPPPTWGEDGGVTLEWETSEAMSRDYSVFLHLYDEQDHRIAQQDALIRDEAGRPTSRWDPGQTGIGLYHLPIAAGTPPGEYDLEIGVYFWKTGEELPLAGAKEAHFPVEVGVPEKLPHAAELRIPHWVERDVTPQLRLLGHGIGKESMVAGETLYLRLFWEALDEMDEAYQLQLGLRGEDGKIYGERQFDLINTDYPTYLWKEGQLLQERYYLPVSERLPTGEATVELSLVNEDGQAVNSDPVSVTQVWVQSTRPSFEIPADIATPSGVTFGEKMRLLGYDVENSVRAGGDIDVTLHWQAQDEMEKTYKVFMHLYDEAGALVAQRDRLPGLGVRPTQVWEKGEVVADRYRIPIDRGIPEGTYQIGIGFYDAETGERLAALGPDGESLDQDRILLGSVEVKR